MVLEIAADTPEYVFVRKPVTTFCLHYFVFIPLAATCFSHSGAQGRPPVLYPTPPVYACHFSRSDDSEKYSY